jgi:phospholipid/cholesterol/gamma-HCH transport system substrate-binding protein
MKNTLETRLGIFFALALVAAFIIMETIGSLDVFKHGIRIHGRFDSVQELKEGDPVKMAGVPVGRVERIELAGDKVDVTMKLDRLGPDAALKTDSIATVRFAGLMGQNFVSITFGSPAAPAAADGFLIKTAAQPDLNSLMAKLDSVASGVTNLTQTFSGGSLQNVLGPLTDFLNENNPRLSAILENTKDITTEIKQGKGTVGKLIYESALYDSALATVTNLNETASDIKRAIAQAQQVVSDINEGKGTIGKLAKDEALYNEATTAMTNLKEILQKINRGEGSAGKLVNDESLYNNAKLSLQKLDKATEGLEDQGPLSVLGLAVNKLF